MVGRVAPLASAADGTISVFEFCLLYVTVLLIVNYLCVYVQPYPMGLSANEL